MLVCTLDAKWLFVGGRLDLRYYDFHFDFHQITALHSERIAKVQLGYAKLAYILRCSYDFSAIKQHLKMFKHIETKHNDDESQCNKNTPIIISTKTRSINALSKYLICYLKNGENNLNSCWFFS